MIGELPLLEDEGLVGYVAKAQKRQKISEELAARRQVHQPVVLLAPDKGCGVNRMILGTPSGRHELADAQPVGLWTCSDRVEEA